MSEPTATRPDPRRGFKLGILAVLVAVAAGLMWHQAHPAAGLLPGFTALPGAAQDGAVRKILAEPDPGLHLDYLASARDVRYVGALRNLFAPAPLAPPPGARQAAGRAARGGSQPATLAGPPPPPPIPLKFYGYATQEGSSKRVFLQMGDDIFVVKQGQIVAHRYQIVRIDKASVAVEDLNEQRTQVLPLIVS